MGKLEEERDRLEQTKKLQQTSLSTLTGTMKDLQESQLAKEASIKQLQLAQTTTTPHKNMRKSRSL